MPRLLPRVTMLRLLSILAVFLAAAAALTLLPRFQEPSLPTQLGNLTLRETLRGDSALALINRLHGKSVAPGENLIGVYAGTGGTATVYLSLYRTTQQAEETFTRMLRGIENGDTPFSHHRRMTIQQTDVSMCLGLGQAHYVFTIDESVYWLAADPSIAQPAVHDLIQALRHTTPGVQV